ncbi:MAG: translation elongation factor Ts [Bacteroidota bacterium]|nr:translation elongation factor Ts [Bacteroidota bacterium]
MSNISAAEVSRLRKTTGAGMMDCKKALQEADGNFEKAIELIRKKGQAVANKRADRDATEGVVLSKINQAGNKVAMIVLNCETDFVAKNEAFVEFADSILQLALANNPASLDELKNLKLGDVTVGENVIEQIGIIGEKLDLSYFSSISAPSVVSYIHPGNKLASAVGFNQENIESQVAKDIAMQIAAMNPVAIDKEDVSQEVIDKEMEIGRDQAKREGKPENILDKIAEGKLNKFFKENTLLNQPFVKDNKKTIKQYLQEQNKDLTVTKFDRFGLSS